MPFLVLGRSPEAGDFVGIGCMADFKGSGKKAWHVDTDRAWVQPGYLGTVRLGKWKKGSVHARAGSPCQ